MIPWLLSVLRNAARPEDLILRMAGAAMLSFLVVLLLGPKVIRFLIRRKFGDRPELDRADLNDLCRHKSNTPTMGGILIVLAIFASVVLFADVRNMYIKASLFVLVWLGCLGAWDDWLKLKRIPGSTSRDGLVMWQKIIFQIGMVVLVAIFIYSYGRASAVSDPATGKPVNPAHSLNLPFVSDPVPVGMLAYVIIAVLTIVGSSNAVNITDGMDGLASGCMIIATLVFLILAEIVGVEKWAYFFNLLPVAGAHEMTVLCAAMIGACLGFLWYNSHPAQVFMGDTGSLPLGGLLGFTALVVRHEVLLIIAGGVFVMEAASVLIQVGYFKYTKRRNGGQGRRVFRAAPVHYHFHLGGWAESKVVIRFWILGIIFAVLALATLKLR
ncbi:MAG: phospho-N-acetylmuramoyl-pentapeptide-transferase [Phycisphaerae bacterium]